MFSKEEAKNLRLEFWNEFGLYCRKHPGLRRYKGKFLLHKTGISHVDLKFDVERDVIRIVLEINHRNENRRLDVYEYVESYKTLIEKGLGKMKWDFAFTRENGQEVSRAYLEMKGKDSFNKNDWQEIFSFMTDKMVVLERNFMDIRDSLKAQLTET